MTDLGRQSQAKANASLFNVIALLLMILALSSCGDEDRVSTTQDNVEQSRGPVALYNISTGEIPYPNLAAFSSTDGTIDLPVSNANDYSDPRVALNASWGFSTSAPIVAGFSEAVKNANLTQGVKMFRLIGFDPKTAGPAYLNCANFEALTSPTQYVPTVSGSNIAITPTQLLNTSSYYLVVITDQIVTDQNSAAFEPDTVYKLLQGNQPLYDTSSNKSLIGIAPDPADAAALESLRQLTVLTETGAKICDSANIGAHTIISSWVFNTVPADSATSMLKMAKKAIDDMPSVSSTLAQIPGAQTQPGMAGDIYAGIMNLPYYLHKASSATDSEVLNEFWKNSDIQSPTPLNPVPIPTATISVPLLVTVPNKFAKGTEKGVVIFQHGITSNRGALLGIADTLAESGYIAVAIDLPLHGILSSDPDLGFLYQSGNERNFDLELDATPGVDYSGEYFINLKNLLVTRDNVQQAVADLFALRKAIATMDYDPVNADGPDLVGKNVYFVGHSLGAIVGIPYFALDASVDAAVFAMPGGAVAKVLDGSAAFGPVIANGLASVGINKGSADYESFMAAAQTVLDITDPVNFSSALAADSSRGILGISVHNDLVVPNIVPDFVSPAGTVQAPVAGTTPLFTLMNLGLTSSSQVSASPIHVWTEFGENFTNMPVANTCIDGLPGLILHKTFLSPNDDTGTFHAESAQALVEMQKQVAAFLESAGKQLVVTDTSYLCTH